MYVFNIQYRTGFLPLLFPSHLIGCPQPAIDCTGDVRAVHDPRAQLQQRNSVVNDKRAHAITCQEELAGDEERQSEDTPHAIEKDVRNREIGSVAEARR